jgi:hypothetical protein
MPRRLVHGLVLFGILLLAAVIMFDLGLLVWGYGPVSEAALRSDSRSVIILIGLYPVGEAGWTGLGAIVLGVLLLAVTLALRWANSSGRVPGLSGIGTRLLYVLTGLGAMGALLGGAYLAATGSLTSAVDVPNYLPTPSGLIGLRLHLITHWHGILVATILGSFVLMYLEDGPDLARTFRRAFSKMELPTVRSDNAWISVFRIYLALLAFHFFYNFILGLFTVEPTVPAFSKQPLWQQLHIFAEASVWEEVLSRVLMLGVPLLIYHTMAARVRRPMWRYLWGGGFKIENAAFFLLFVQALIFALAHVAGWDFWKVLPTTMSGMAFGYLFLRKGVHVAIALHFTFDYLGMNLEVLKAWGIDPTVGFNVMVLFFLAVGTVLLVHYIVIFLEEGPEAVRTALFGASAEPPGEG